MSHVEVTSILRCHCHGYLCWEAPEAPGTQIPLSLATLATWEQTEGGKVPM